VKQYEIAPKKLRIQTGLTGVPILAGCCVYRPEKQCSLQFTVNGLLTYNATRLPMQMLHLPGPGALGRVQPKAR
jgi:hypothetical protein